MKGGPGKYSPFGAAHAYGRSERRPRPAISDIRNNTIKMKNKILAIEAALAAMPKNPKIPATMAIIRKITAQRNIALSFIV
jgi:hypothetical protein